MSISLVQNGHQHHVDIQLFFFTIIWLKNGSLGIKQQSLTPCIQ